MTRIITNKMKPTKQSSFRPGGRDGLYSWLMREIRTPAFMFEFYSRGFALFVDRS
jgi:hypothetical protein